MSPQAKSDLARQHFTRARGAFEAGDLVVGVTFLHLSAEAAIVALAEQHGIPTERQHWRKAEAATELNVRGVLSTDLSPILGMLNQTRKDAGYEGEDPNLGDWTTRTRYMPRRTPHMRRMRRHTRPKGQRRPTRRRRTPRRS